MYFRLFMKFIIVFVVTAVAAAGAKDDRIDIMKKFECVSDVVKEFCIGKCGTSHFCLLGRCFCGYDETADDDAEIESMFIRPNGLPQEVPQSDESPTKQRRKADILLIHTFLNADTIFPKVSLQNDNLYNQRQQHKKSSMNQFDKTYYPSTNTVSSRSEVSKLQTNQPSSLILMLNMISDRKPQQQLTSSCSSEVGKITKPGVSNTYLQKLQLPEENLPRPALRHHIAHFCPNLEVARTCIQKCMKQGKPAFCGKDHVCYCGHDYGVPSENIVIDPEQVRLQYKDLYTKYFGPLSSR